MLKIDSGVNSSKEIFGAEQQMEEKNKTNLSVIAQKTVLDVEQEFIDFNRTPKEMADQYRALQK